MMIKTVLVLLCLLFTMPISYAANTPCSGNKNGIAHCEGSQFICNDGSVSASKLDCSTTFVAINVEQRVIQCFFEDRIISPQLARTNINKVGNNYPDLP
ncbi:MAG: hypothetical protein WCK96_12230 [Methylococcales bacterium]